MSKHQIIYSGNFADPRFLGTHIPVKVFKRDGLKKSAEIMKRLTGTLQVSRRACLVTCVDGEVTQMTNLYLGKEGIEQCTSL